MEENKKFDVNSFIGFLLIGGIILYWLSTKQSEEAKKDKGSKAQTESVTKNQTDSANLSEEDTVHINKISALDSTAKESSNEYAVNSIKNDTTIFENNVLKLKIANKGGQIVEAKLKNETTYDSLPVYLVKDNSASLGLNFTTVDNKMINTKDRYFEPSLSSNGQNKVLTMKYSLSPNEYLEYIYTLKPDDHMMGFVIRSQGLKNVISQSQPIDLNWKMKTFRLGKSISYEHRYTRSVWHYEGTKNSDQWSSSDTEDKDKDISWIAYRQHFFTSILLNDNSFEKGDMHYKYLVDEEKKDTVFIAALSSTFPLQLKGGEINENMNLYYGPSDYKTLKSYDRNLDEIIPLGWGIFGWINKFIFIPIFSFLLSFLPAGISIILLTIIVKTLLSPVQYKQFYSQAKRKILKPEIDAITEKYKSNKMKLQQETMKLNRKAGINQTSGCLVGLIQMPIFYAMFRLFPSAFELRHHSFLWAKDLSTFDSIAHLPFSIPFYGDHVSLFALLAAVAILIYMKLTTGQNLQSMPQQPGMPNMKYIMYLSPIFMLVFFNRYPSGLSLYYLTSNLIAIGIFVVIQYYIIDEDKVHAKIQEHKKKPKKTNRFQRKMQEMMEEAERQKNLKK